MLPSLVKDWLEFIQSSVSLLWTFLLASHSLNSSALSSHLLILSWTFHFYGSQALPWGTAWVGSSFSPGIYSFIHKHLPSISSVLDYVQGTRDPPGIRQFLSYRETGSRTSQFWWVKWLPSYKDCCCSMHNGFVLIVEVVQIFPLFLLKCLSSKESGNFKSRGL